MQHSAYYDPEQIALMQQHGTHREAVGGLWEEMGAHQLDFLIAHGMQPEHYLLDIGCGALRLGSKAINYLLPNHYFGQDLSPALLDAGYEKELPPALQQKLPRTHLNANFSFDFSFLGTQKIDIAIAQSVFTHLPLNHIRRCLAQLSPHLKTGGFFFATAWIVPDTHPLETPYEQRGKLGDTPIITTDIADPYHYHLADFTHIISPLPYRLHYIGDWQHPRHQLMLCFEKL